MKLLACLLPGALAACTSPDPAATGHAATAAAAAALAGATAPAGAGRGGAAALAAAAPPAGRAAPVPPAAPYEVRGILDPGMQNMVAFALKIPRGWLFQQQFTRKWNGATPISQVSLRLTAPDGQRQIDFLPERPYYFQDGPTARSLRQQAAALGLPPTRHDEYELAPLAPLAYIRQVLLPDLARQGLRFQPGAARELPARATGPQARTATAYVDGRLPDGRRARVECVVNTSAQGVGGEAYYNWAALPSLTQTPGDLAACYAYTQAARQSFAVNPAWQRRNQELTQRGQAADQAITQRDQAAYRAYQAHQQQLQQQTTADRQRSQDQIARSRGDLLRGQTQYDNAATGERVRTADRYAHVYQDRNGALHGSPVALDAGALDWQELQRVELGSY